MYLCVFEDSASSKFLPLVHTRPVFDLRLGAETILESLQRQFPEFKTLVYVRPEIAAVTSERLGYLTNRIPDGLDVLFINGRLKADAAREVITQVKELVGGSGAAITWGAHLIAAWIPGASNFDVLDSDSSLRASLPHAEAASSCLLDELWELFDEMPRNIEAVFQHVSKGYNIFERPNVTVENSTEIISEEHVFVGPGTYLGGQVVLDASTGPIIIGKNARIEHRSVIVGPAYIGEKSVVKVGANIRRSAIGPVCKVAGEVHTSVLHSHSNKAHDGFLGHSLIGEWCNLGAATNNSNLKNNYGPVDLYSEAAEDFVSTGRQFMGLVMGDHSKCGISTMFSTGTVVGVSCNIFGGGYQPRFIPSFAWGGPKTGFVEYRIDKAKEVAIAVARRREVDLSLAELELLDSVLESTADQRARANLL